MNCVKKITSAIGLGLCWPMPIPDNYELKLQKVSKVPIFWLMGPDGAGKHEFSALVANATKYTIIDVQKFIKEEVAKNKIRGQEISYYLQKGQPAPIEAVVSIIREYIHLNYHEDPGYIILGFPDTLKEAKLFELAMGKVFILIYCSLDVELLMDRIYRKYGHDKIDASKLKKKYMEQHKNCQEIYRRYENKTIKVHMNLI